MAKTSKIEKEDLKRIADCGENNIEFLRDAKTATVCFSQGRYVSRIRKLAEEHPDECKILYTNSDGSIVAHIPTKWVKISASKRVMTDEQKEAASERLKQYHKQKKKGKK